MKLLNCLGFNGIIEKNKRGKIKMKKFRILPIILLLLAVLAACSKVESDDVSTTAAQTQAQTEYDFSPVVDAFAEITQGDLIDEITDASESALTTLIDELTSDDKTTEKETQAEESTAKETEKATEKTTAKATEATTEKATEPESSASTTVKVTVKEGQALTEIFKVLDEKGVADFDELMETAATYDYSYYPLVAAIPSNANRCFKLEGYLFPDTYEFYYGQKPQDVIGRFLRNGKAKITDSMMSQASALGYSMDEVITVASIIEKEGANSKEVAKIAAVIYNRLEAGMKLQMDSSIYYIERHVKPYLTGDVNRYNSYYNTYKCSALPAGPISNPGMRTINAALNPADVPYLYFCHDENANYYYAETYEEHQENLKLAGLA